MSMLYIFTMKWIENIKYRQTNRKTCKHKLTLVTFAEAGTHGDHQPGKELSVHHAEGFKDDQSQIRDKTSSFWAEDLTRAEQNLMSIRQSEALPAICGAERAGGDGAGGRVRVCDGDRVRKSERVNKKGGKTRVHTVCCSPSLLFLHTYPPPPLRFPFTFTLYMHIITTFSLVHSTLKMKAVPVRWKGQHLKKPVLGIFKLGDNWQAIGLAGNYLAVYDF